MSTAQTMKIYNIIGKIERELNEAPRKKFGAQDERVVETDRLFDLLDDLKVTIPEDIRRASGVISEAENTINEAKERANDIVEKAQQEADDMLAQAQTSAENLYHQAESEFQARVSDAEVYKEAYTLAQQIHAEAEANANAIYNGARKYADDILADIQRYISEYHRMIATNREELGVIPEPEKPAYQPEPRRQAPVQPQAAPLQSAVLAPEYADDAQPVDGATRPFTRADAHAMQEPHHDDGNGYEDEETVKPTKKKGLFKRMFEADDDEEFDEEDEDWEPEAKPAKQKQKKKKKMFDFDDDEDDTDF